MTRCFPNAALLFPLSLLSDCMLPGQCWMPNSTFLYTVSKGCVIASVPRTKSTPATIWLKITITWIVNGIPHTTNRTILILLHRTVLPSFGHFSAFHLFTVTTTLVVVCSLVPPLDKKGTYWHSSSFFVHFPGNSIYLCGHQATWITGDAWPQLLTILCRMGSLAYITLSGELLELTPNSWLLATCNLQLSVTSVSNGSSLQLLFLFLVSTLAYNNSSPASIELILRSFWRALEMQFGKLFTKINFTILLRPLSSFSVKPPILLLLLA